MNILTIIIVSLQEIINNIYHLLNHGQVGMVAMSSVVNERDLFWVRRNLRD